MIISIKILDAADLSLTLFIHSVGQVSSPK
jgi:hypothetical protein